MTFESQGDWNTHQITGGCGIRLAGQLEHPLRPKLVRIFSPYMLRPMQMHTWQQDALALSQHVSSHNRILLDQPHRRWRRGNAQSFLENRVEQRALFRQIFVRGHAGRRGERGSELGAETVCEAGCRADESQHPERRLDRVGVETETDVSY